MAKALQIVVLLCIAAVYEGKPSFENDRTEYTDINQRNLRSMDDEEFHNWLTQMERNFNEGFEEYLKQTEDDEEYEGERKKREDEKDPFQSLMETMQQGFDKDFDEFMKEMEKEMSAEYGDADDKTKRDVVTIELPDSMRDQTIMATTAGKTEYTQTGRTDSYDNFLISVEREASGDFEKFMNDLAKFDNSGNKKREVSKKYELFELWKENERRNALQRYELFKNEGRGLNNAARNSRDTKDERSLTDMVNFFPNNNKQKSASTRCSDY